jgi:glutamate synthase (NADPH/NADH) small chain
MLTFAKTRRGAPKPRPSPERIADFNEITAPFEALALHEQSERCAGCGVPFCQSGCPLDNDIPDWLNFAADGRTREAWDLSQATNTLPEICGRICPQDRLCEANCVPGQAGFGAITIGAVETALSETAWKKGWITPIKPPVERKQSVAIIGAGPAGMAAAASLREAGMQVHIYERADRPGGLLTYGIPAFKLEKEVVLRRTDWLGNSGVNFHLNCEIGKDVSLAQLRRKHDAVLMAGGVYQARQLSVPGASDKVLVPALDYLIGANRLGFGDVVPGYDSGRLNAKDKQVVVIGGGDTAMDCVRTAVRQKAKKVTCLYRRDEDNMPGSRKELQNAREEGVDFFWLAAPKSIHDNGKVPTEIRAIRMQLGGTQDDGRAAPQEIAGSAFALPADMIITALGFTPDDLPKAFAAPDLETTSWGSVAVGRGRYDTSLGRVYAAGDCVRGASLVVWAIRDGRDAAAQIIKDMLSKEGAP